MKSIYAKDFWEISEVIKVNSTLQNKILNLIRSEPIAGKVIEKNVRLDNFREILIAFFELKIDLNTAIYQTEEKLVRDESI